MKSKLKRKAGKNLNQPKPPGKIRAERVRGNRMTSGAAQTQMHTDRVQDEPNQAIDQYFPIVAIGASAGGLDPCQKLLAGLRPDTGLAFVFIQHLSPMHESLLPEILQRSTEMPVKKVKQGMVVEPNHVYVIPANSNIGLIRGILQVMPRIDIPGRHMPIDIFFRCLAADRRELAIGVVVSGADGDGSTGLRAIKAEAGITFVQDPHTAEVSGMPSAALLGGAVDYSLPIEEIAEALNYIGTHPALTYEKAESKDADEKLLARLFLILRKQRGHDFSSYKLPMIRRRIHRRMVLLKLHHLKDYVRHASENAAEVEALAQDFLINVTNFFRDATVFDFLKEKIFPGLFLNRPVDQPIRIWVPGCSTGEEAYSLAICLHEYVRANRHQHRIQIFGTDLSESAIERARIGIYPEGIKTDVLPERLDNYFSKVPHGFRVSRALRDMCIFANQDVTQDPPFSRLDLVSCRNVLIYLGPDLQKRVLGIFHYAMNPDGQLILGTSENVGLAPTLFTLVDKQHRIFSRKSSTDDRGTLIDVRSFRHEPLRNPSPSAAAMRSAPDGSAVFGDAIRVIMNRYAPASVIVNGNSEIVQTLGSTGPYLELSVGQPTMSILRLAREGLSVELRALLKKAKRTGLLATSKPLRLLQNDAFIHVEIEVIPLRENAGGRNFLVTFQKKAPADAEVATRLAEWEAGPKGTKPASARRDRSALEGLRQELASTKDYLKSIVHEYESSTEELQSANEEILSSNEELQSTNEELETAKEELQSTNEELTTVNEELFKRYREIIESNNDLNNLLVSVNLPIVMVSGDLTVRRLTSKAADLWHILQTDVGRKISSMRLGIKIASLDQLILNCIASATVVEKAVKDADGQSYRLRISPYHTAENSVEGAVLLLTKVTRSRKRR